MFWLVTVHPKMQTVALFTHCFAEKFFMLFHLIVQVHVHLKSSNWDTRIAAGEAIEAIASNVPKWEPAGLIVKCIVINYIIQPSIYCVL